MVMNTLLQERKAIEWIWKDGYLDRWDGETHCKQHDVLLQEHSGKSEDFYICLLCREDYKEKQRKEFVECYLPSSGIDSRFENKTLANYIRENKGQKGVINEINTFLENLDSSAGLIMIGKPGTGKTHLASAIVREVITEKQKVAKTTKVARLIREVKSSWSDRETTESNVIEEHTRPTLLVIDEVGVQNGTDFERNILTEIIDERYSAMKPTILVGNLTLKEMVEMTSERAIDRFKEGGKVLVFDWSSYRGKVEIVGNAKNNKEKNGNNN